MIILFVAMIGFAAGSTLSNWSNSRYILLKAASYGRTAMCVRGQFIYAVPENEYVEMKIATLPRFPNPDPTP